MEGKKVKLLGFWVSPFVLRVEWALKLKGVDYEYIEEDVYSNKSPLLLELNPVHAKVPILVHGEKPIIESLVILEYIDETWKEKPLLPQDPRERAMARFWAKFTEQKIFVIAFYAMGCKGSEQERAASLVTGALEKLEEELKQRRKRFFGGDEGIGYLDLGVGWVSYMLPVFEEVGSMRIFNPQKFPTLTSWMSNFLDQRVVKGSLPAKDRMIQFFQGIPPSLASRMLQSWLVGSI